jgi:hypothetical protein
MTAEIERFKELAKFPVIFGHIPNESQDNVEH